MSDCSYPMCMMGGQGCDYESDCLGETKKGVKVEKVNTKNAQLSINGNPIALPPTAVITMHIKRPRFYKLKEWWEVLQMMRRLYRGNYFEVKLSVTPQGVQSFDKAMAGWKRE